MTELHRDINDAINWLIEAQGMEFRHRVHARARLVGEIEKLQITLETLQKNYDLGQAALALAESEGKEVASRWATAVTLLEKAERERSEARSRLVSAEQERDAWRHAYHKLWQRPVEIRMPGGELDEIVGYGGFHVEQMDDNYWFFDLAGCAFFVDGESVELRIRDFGTWDEAMKHYAAAHVVEERGHKCLGCDEPIPAYGYCPACIEKMRTLIDGHGVPEPLRQHEAERDVERREPERIVYRQPKFYLVDDATGAERGPFDSIEAAETASEGRMP